MCQALPFISLILPLPSITVGSISLPSFQNVDFSLSQVPAVVFQYDLSPISIVETLKFRPFYQFITNFMAIIGGVFAVRHVHAYNFYGVTVTFRILLLTRACIPTDDWCFREFYPPNFTEYFQKEVVDKNVFSRIQLHLEALHIM